MARFQYYVGSSLDGFIATEDDNLDWLMHFDGFEGSKESFDDFMAGVGAIVMGADTYRFILREGPDAWTYGRIPTWVFAHRELAGIPGADITFVRGDAAEFAPDIAAGAGDRNVWVVGGGSLAGQFADAGLLDDLILFTMPVALGSGKPLLAVSGEVSLELISSRTFERGVLEHRYRFTAR